MLSPSLLILLSMSLSLKPKTLQACAVCKYQRRKCSKDCQLAPYFPGDQPEKFQNAHRLFGVSNILKILKQVPKERRDEAMESVVYESNMRARFPVHGCREVIWRLHFQIHQKMEELNYVRSCIATLRNQCKHRLPPPDLEFHSSTQAKTIFQKDHVFEEETALFCDDKEYVRSVRIGGDGNPCVKLKCNTNTKTRGESSAVK